MPRDSVSVPASASAPDLPDVRRYFPLYVGYVWSYREQVVTDTDTVLLQRRVTLTVQSRHEQAYIAHWDFQSGRSRLPNSRYRLVDDGVQWAQLTADRRYTPFAYLLKAPLVVGQSWRTGPGAEVRITSIHAACTVPAGTFPRCVETLHEVDSTPASRVHTRRRFAPDVGLVWQQRRLFVNQTLQRIDTLQLHQLPKRSRL